MKRQYDHFVGFVVSAGERRKLERLAQQTGRNVSQVLRLLISQAELPDRVDIQVNPLMASGKEGCDG